MDPSDAHFSARPLRPVEEQRPPRLDGPPVLRRALSLRAVPTTPASHPEPGGYPGPGYSGLPRVKVGSALATSLSGPAQGSLAFGPQTCWPSFRELLSGRLDDLQLPGDHPPVATRLYRQLPRQDSHLLDRATFARRTLTFAVSDAREPWARRLRHLRSDLFPSPGSTRRRASRRAATVQRTGASGNRFVLRLCRSAQPPLCPWLLSALARPSSANCSSPVRAAAQAASR